MTDKDRLMELLNNTFSEQYEKSRLITEHETANYLLANGVIVAPMPMAEWLRQELTEHIYMRCIDEL